MEKLKKTYLRGIIILCFLSLPLVVLSIIFPKTIIYYLYGAKYLQAVPALVILSYSIPFFFMNALPANIILNSQHLKQFLPWEFAKIICNFILCVILIPRYSLLGAAWAMVFSEIIGFTLNNLFVYNVLKQKSR